MATVRVLRESAHVYSKVVDKSTVPNTITWAALVCVTAPKGELNNIYTLTSHNDLTRYFGTPTKDHTSLICADKLVSNDCSLYAIRVAHENSLASSSVYIKQKNYVYQGTGTYDSSIQTASELILQDENNKNIKNVTSYLTFEGSESISSVYTMWNKDVVFGKNSVYQIDSETNKPSNELTKYCLVLSDVLNEDNVQVYKKDESEPIDSNLYETGWFCGYGKNKKSAIVFDLSTSPLSLNEKVDVSFEAKQTFVLNTGSSNNLEVYCYMQSKAGGSEELIFSDPEFVIE